MGIIYLNIFFSILILFATNIAGDVILKDVFTEEGLVRGYKNPLYEYFQFLGIPYAAAPIGNNRFKPPLPAPRRSEIFYANKSIICAQFNETNEDCLVVNIYIPSKKCKHLPVLFYVHGGAFIGGAGIYSNNVKNLIKENIIIVTVNYRLSYMGFLCLGIKEAPGNVGMKDIVAALKWVKKNIRDFEGDRDDITVAGTSAGAAAVDLLVLSPLAKGLFKGAIVESGSALTPWALDNEPIKNALNVAVAMGYNGNFTLEDIAQFYKKADVKTLNNYMILNFLARTNGTVGFVPCIEKVGDNAFLSENPLDIISKRFFSRIPILYIFVNGEGFFRESQFYDYKDQMNDNFSKFLPANLDFRNDYNMYKASNKTKEFYFRAKNVSEETIVPYLNFFGDSLFIYPIINSTKNIACENTEDVYLLEFCYEGGLNNKKPLFSNISGGSHGDSLNYVFAKNNVTNSMDRDIVELMVSVWSSFIKCGSPNFPNWRPWKRDTMTYLRVNNNTKVLERPYLRRMDFWATLYSKYRRKLTSVGG